jgi:type VI secretion system protein ImpL
MPGLYTKQAFQQISTAGQLELVKQFVSDNWVLGGDVAAIARTPQLSSQFMQLYEDDYIRQWDSLLGDLTLRTTTSTQDAAQLWGLLGATTSPFKRLLELVTINTTLVDPTGKPSAADKAKAALGSTLGTLGKVFGSEQQAAAAPPGTRTTQHFEPLHKLVAGSPAPIDATLQKFADIQKVLAEVNALGGPPQRDCRWH